MDGKENYFTISQLSAMLDISGPTLRFWESEFAGVFTPLRTSGGQRRYTDAHIDILEKIISLKKKGLKLTEIRAEMMRTNLVDGPAVSREKIDILAERISRAVKKEIHKFFQGNGRSAESKDLNKTDFRK